MNLSVVWADYNKIVQEYKPNNDPFCKNKALYESAKIILALISIITTKK